LTDPTNADINRPIYGNFTPSTTIPQAGGIPASGITTIPVVSNASFPATGNFVVKIDNELLQVTRTVGSTTSLTIVQRGYNNTIPASHLINAAVNQVFEIPASGSLTSQISIADAFTILQSTTRSFFDGQVQTKVATGGGPISAVTNTIPVQATFGFPIPAVGEPFVPFVIKIGSEEMRVTAVSGANNTQWTVIRGINNTLATSHNNNDPVLLGTPGTIQLEMDITHPEIRDLTVTLTSPTGQVIQLVSNLPIPSNAATTDRADFRGTVFDDSATTSIQAKIKAPILTGPFNPKTPLSVLDGQGSAGNWTLTITNNGATGSRGVLTHWELRLPRTVVGSGLGEEIADRLSASFRIFTQASDNAQSADQWTPIGPAAANVFTGDVQTVLNLPGSGGTLGAVTTTFPVGSSASFPDAPFTIKIDNEQMKVTHVDRVNDVWTVIRGYNGTTAATHADLATILLRESGANVGRIGALAVDPSDPSGNTVFVAGASGGVWKTTNFLTTDPNGPSYVQLTDLGPTYSLNISSIAVFPRNNDPNQTVVFVATGDGDGDIGTAGGGIGGYASAGRGSPGVGFLRSMDGGRTWDVLDSTTNVSGAGGILPMNSVQRDHLFVGSTSFKITVDPVLRDGKIVVYAALSSPTLAANGGANGGLWRSLDSGNTWVRMRAGNATDVYIAAGSRDAKGNASLVYAAFEGEGVFKAETALTSAPLTLMDGTDNFVTRVNGFSSTQLVTARGATPNGAKGRIVLASPALTNDPLQDTYLKNWLYAAVVAADGTLDGVYLTKDRGASWTKLNLPSTGGSFGGFGTNNETRTNIDVLSEPRLGGGLLGRGDYSISFTIDPNNPNIVYLGGVGGMIRIDATLLDDPYKLVGYADDRVLAAGQTGTMTTTTGPTNVTSSNYEIIDQLDPSLTPLAPYINLYRAPNNPFSNNSTLNFSGVASPPAPPAPQNVIAFNNTGFDVFWQPFDGALDGTVFHHDVIAFRDPLTGATRLIFGDENGVYTGVDDGKGNLIQSIGSADFPTGTRNGNLQITQFFQGASQPSTLAANLMGAMFYGQSTNNGSLQSSGDILETGNLNWTGFSPATGVGVATDQTGSGTLYQFSWPIENGPLTDAFINSGGTLNFTASDFFVITQSGLGTVSRASGLLLPGEDPGLAVGQWLQQGGSNIAVNTYDGSAVVVSSSTGRIYLTAGQQDGYGQSWRIIGGLTGDPSNTATPLASPDLDGRYAGALAFGAPIPDSSGNVDPETSNNFIYAGTDGGKIFVTFDGRGYNGSTKWRDISGGLDGSPVQQIVTNPKPGSYEAYAVTQFGVYWMKDSHAGTPGSPPTWVKLNDLFTGGTTTLNASIAATGNTITVPAGATGFPATPFMIQVGTEQMRVNNINGTTWTVDRGFNMTLTAAHTAGDFIQQINPLFGGTRTGATTNLNGAIAATGNTITVAAGATGFPATPFIIQVGAEQMRVNNINGTTWTVDRGFNKTTAAAHANNSPVLELQPIVGVNRPVFNAASNPDEALQYLTTIQADWRVAIPSDLGTGAVTTINAASGGIDADDTTMVVDPTAPGAAQFPTGSPFVPFTIQIDTELIQVTSVDAAGTTWTINRGFNGTTAAAHGAGATVYEFLTHPVLYVGGEGGIFRSVSKGKVWTNFPNLLDDGATQEGGYLPSAHITDLDLALGNFNPVTGFFEQPTGLNALVATTYGRGSFAIRIDNSAVSTSIVAPVSGPRVLTATPIITNFGSTFAGYEVTFVDNIDPNTFQPGDVIVTRPGAPAITIGSVTDVSGAPDVHNKFQILFQTPQTVNATYTLKIGPDVRDTAGAMMDQNFNNTNGQVPADVFSNTFTFVQNTPPTITNPGNKIIQPGVTSATFNFTVGDAQTPAGSLIVTATSSNTAVLDETIPGQIILGGSGANRTIAFAPDSFAHGVTTITLTVKDGNQLPVFVTFTVNVDQAPTFGPVADPTTVQHGSAQVPTIINLGGTDPDPGDMLGYSVSLLDPLFSLKTQLGLTNPATLFNATKHGEYFFLSNNPAANNPAGGGYYVLASDNKLYAWTGNYNTTVVPGRLVADFNSSTYLRNVYAEPDLLTKATAPTSGGTSASAGEALTTDVATLALAAVKLKFGLTNPAIMFNATGHGEWFFLSTNGSNAPGGGYYVLAGDNKLYAWTGNYNTTVLQSPVADFNDPKFSGANVSGNPALLSSATRVLAGSGVGASLSGGTLTLTPTAGFEGSLTVSVTVTDGTIPVNKMFRYTVNNAVPTLDPISDVTVTHDVGTANVPLPYADAGDNSPPVYRVDVTGYNPLYDVKVKYGLTNSAIMFNATGHSEWFFLSTNGSNAPGGGYYVLVNNKLYAWTGNYNTTVAASAVVDFSDTAFGGVNVSAAPNMIPKASEPTLPTVLLNRGPLYDVKELFGLTAAPTMFNATGHSEWYFQSTNLSNAANGGYYVLVPSGPNSGGLLYAWQGNFNASVAQPPVADLTSAPVWSQPSLLTGARPVFIGDLVYDVKERLGLTNSATLFNATHHNEYFFLSTNPAANNPAGGGYYVLASDNKLYAWTGNYNTTVVPGQLAADFGATNVYANPLLLTQATGKAPAVVGTVAGNTLTITGNAAFAGTVRVTVVAGDGAESTSQSFLFTVTNAAPSLDPITNQTGMSTSTGTTVDLSSFNLMDANGDMLQSAVKISGNPLFALKTQLGLTNPATMFDATHHGEFFFQSTNNSNSAGGGFYVLATDNKLYAWTGQYSTTVAGAPVADFNAGVYNGINVYNGVMGSTSFLANQTQPVLTNVSGSVTGSTLNLFWPNGFTGIFAVTVTFGDKANEVERSFLVTVS
jgi:subtilisin-like proprotein convertase family protein